MADVNSRKDANDGRGAKRAGRCTLKLVSRQRQPSVSCLMSPVPGACRVYEEARRSARKSPCRGPADWRCCSCFCGASSGSAVALGTSSPLIAEVRARPTELLATWSA